MSSFTTRLQGKSLNPGNGQLVQDGNILIITNINRAQSGDYICEAKNQHGRGLSKTLNLKVRGKSMNYTLRKLSILSYIHHRSLK